MHRKKWKALAIGLIIATAIGQGSTAMPIYAADIYETEIVQQSETIEETIDNMEETLDSVGESIDSVGVGTEEITETVIEVSDNDAAAKLLAAVNNEATNVKIKLTGNQNTTIVLSEALEIPAGKTVTIEGAESENIVYTLQADENLIEAEDRHDISFISVPSTATLNLLNITVDANKQGRVICNEGTMDLMKAVIKGGYLIGYKVKYADMYGAGIYNKAGATVTIESSSIIENEIYGGDLPTITAKATLYGVGIANEGCVTINDSNISNNDALSPISTKVARMNGMSLYGTAIYNIGTFNMSKVNINKNEAKTQDFPYNSNTLVYGGIIYTGKDGNFTADDCMITDNSVDTSETTKLYSTSYNISLAGGIVCLWSSGKTSFSNVTISDNRQMISGVTECKGAIYIMSSGSGTEMKDTAIINNTVTSNEEEENKAEVQSVGLNFQEELTISGTIQINGNTWNGSPLDVVFYSPTSSINVCSSLTEGSNINLSGYATSLENAHGSENAQKAVVASDDYTLTDEDFSYFHVNTEPAENICYLNKVMDTENLEKIAAFSMYWLGAEENEEEYQKLVSKTKEYQTQLDSASTDSKNPTVIELEEDLVVTSTLTINAGTYVEIKSKTGEATHTIMPYVDPFKDAVTTLMETSGNLVLSNVTLDEQQQGKVLSVKAGDTILNAGATITGGHITTNKNAEGAGVIIAKGASVTMNNGAKICGNTGAELNYLQSPLKGLGVYIAENGAFHMTGGEISDNTTEANCTVQGGGIYAYPNATLQITGGTIANNSAVTGGAIFDNSASSYTLENVTISGNSACGTYNQTNEDALTVTGNMGGAIYKAGGTLTLENVTISGNEAVYGGAIYLVKTEAYDAAVIMKSGNIENNTAKINNKGVGCGGGIYTDATVTIEGGSITGNSITNPSDYAVGEKQGLGGGIYLRGYNSQDSAEKPTTLNLYGGEISNNQALGDSNGVYASNFIIERSGTMHDSAVEALYGASNVNVKGAPKVLDGLCLAPAEYLSIDSDPTTLLAPQYITLSGALENGASLKVTKKLLEYQTGSDSRGLDGRLAVGTSSHQIDDNDISHIEFDLEYPEEGLYGKELKTTKIENDFASYDSTVYQVVEANVSMPETAEYTGNSIEPAIEVTSGENTLTVGKDYTVSYADADGNTVEQLIDMGNYTVTVTGIGDYIGTVTKTFSITFTVTLGESDFVYNGTEQKPGITVTLDGQTLTENVDYTVSYYDADENVVSEPIDAGTYTVTITGKGTYEGASCSKTYEIKPMALSDSIVTLDLDSAEYSGKAQTFGIVVKAANGNTLAEDTDYTVSYLDEDGKTVDSLINAGEYTVRVSGKGNYTGTVTAATKFTITPSKVFTPSLDNNSFVYNGEVQKPVVTVTGVNDELLTEGTDYDIVNPDNKNPGDYQVTVTGKGNYEGNTWTGDYTIQAVSVTGVTLNKTNLSLVAGKSETLTATVNPTGATNKNVTWTSSNTKVATVNAGKVTAVAAGTATITVKTEDGNKTATCNVTVTSATVAVTKVTNVSLSKTSLTIAKGKSTTLAATVTPANATNKAVTWTSSNTKVATVTSTGTVKGIKAGKATITATAKDGSGKKATCTVTVTQVTLNATSMALQVKKSTTALKATTSLKTDKVTSWTSSNKKVATVTSKGKVKGIKTGTAKITVTTKSGATATCTVKVQKAKVVTKKLSISSKKLTLKKGKKATLTVTRNPISATEKITWTSSNKKVATVTNKGKVTAKKAGKATITAKSSNGKKVTCKVTVKK